MGKLDYGILTKGKNKVGPVVYYRRGSLQLARAYVSEVKNPNTKPQQLARARFTVLRNAARAFKSAANLGFAKLAHDATTPTNIFMKMNYGALQGDSPSQVEIDFSKVKVSDGDLPMPGFASASSSESLIVDVTWTPNSDLPDASTQDQVYVFVYQEDLNGGILSTPVNRSIGGAHVSVPSGWSGMRCQVYAFAIGDGNDNKGMRSYSAYLGSTVVS